MVAARDAGVLQYVLAAKSSGFACDYGHGDLVLGKTAPLPPRPGEHTYGAGCVKGRNAHFPR